MPPKLGILAGRGTLPARIIQACRETGRDYFVIAFKEQTAPETVAGSPHAWVRLGAAGRALRCLRDAGVEELVMAGGVHRPSLSALRPDAWAVKVFAKMGGKALGDDGLLSALVTALEDEGFRMVGADDVVSDLLAPQGPLGAIVPAAEAKADIALGIEVALGLGALDVGQAVVVQQGLVLGVEAAEGTDALIERCAGLRRSGFGGVLVKVKKPGQERRADLPTIGVSTVTAVAAAGLGGIAVEAGGTLVMDRVAMAAAADRAGVFVIGVPVPDDAPA